MKNILSIFTSTLLIAGFAMFSSCGENNGETDKKGGVKEADFTQMAAYYTANCLACHGAKGEGSIGPALVGDKATFDVEGWKKTILTGQGLMAGFPDADTDNLIKYLKEGLGK